jgi:hypothetical protein
MFFYSTGILGALTGGQGLNMTNIASSIGSQIASNMGLNNQTLGNVTDTLGRVNGILDGINAPPKAPVIPPPTNQPLALDSNSGGAGAGAWTSGSRGVGLRCLEWGFVEVGLVGALVFNAVLL